jgi:hypothetical protein
MLPRQSSAISTLNSKVLYSFTNKGTKDHEGKSFSVWLRVLWLEFTTPSTQS